MEAVREQFPDVSFTGVGLSRMSGQGLERVHDEASPDGSMWLHNVLKLRYFRRLLQRCRSYLQSTPPDLVVLVDYGGFNMYLAHAASQAGVPVLYYIPPQVWAHGGHRAKKLRKWVDRLAVIYPFEEEFYRSRGVAADYVGHPLFDELEENPSRDKKVQELRNEDRCKIVGLFPGSREQEVRRHLPVALDACVRIADRWPGVRFPVVCPEGVEDLAHELTADREALRIEFPDASPAEVASASSMCLTKSGTVTLELASQECPMIIFYRVSAFSYFIASGLRTSDHIGLVNSLAGRTVCRERLMWRKNSRWLAEQALELGSDPERYEGCKQSLHELMEDFAQPGASSNAADIVADMIS